MRFKREIKDYWKVEYNEMSFPAIQKGWVLPPDRYDEFDPFILMAEDWFKKGTFPDHPHRGFQTVTYVIDGRLEHIDNAGGREILGPGDVQYMNAGWAARHAEDGVEDDIAHTLQLWVNLPKDKKKSETIYQNVHNENAPIVEFKGGQLKVFSGEVEGKKGPLTSIVPLTLTELTLQEGASYNLHLPETHHSFVYVLSGKLSFGESESSLSKHHTGLLTKSNDQSGESSELFIQSHERQSKVLVYSGQPINETIVPYGPFVMNTMEEIKQAYKDYHDDKFGPPAK